MGTSHGDFIKFPRTPHLFGSTGTTDDEHLTDLESLQILANPTLVIEEKIDGANVGMHFSADERLVLQCRGHLLTEGDHPQFDLFKQWAAAKQTSWVEVLQKQYIVFGEWLYAKHTIHYRNLPHFFLAFDVYDKQRQAFVDQRQRLDILRMAAIHSVPVVHTGPIKREQLDKLVGSPAFSSDTRTAASESLLEGLYLRTDSDGIVNGRAKYVRRQFVVEMLKHDNWRHEAIVPNLLSGDADIWS